jgi:predicted nucleotidyltransferase component of viral defense system
MSEIYWNTVTADMRAILSEFSRSQAGAKFYLAGGTALSLQLGHRLSVDLDFFSPTEDIPTIRPALEKALASFSPVLADSAWGNLVYLARNVRVGFYGYGCELVAPLVETPESRLASIEDIALMKLDALLARAARKDFYDLYFICQKISLRHILDLAPRKYPSTRDFETQTVKRLVYFENAEQDVEPQMLSPVTWEQVKNFFTAQSKDIANRWLA